MFINFSFSALNSKKEIRKLIYKFRKEISEKKLKEWSNIICKRIIETEFYQKSKVIICYFPKKGEVDTKVLIGYSFLHKKKVFLPKVILSKKSLEFYQVFCLDNVVPGPFKLLEPPLENPKLKDEKVDVVFVPGVAFDIFRNRIGYGGGFYDRILKRIKALKVGIAFSFQIFERLPISAHDEKLDLIITEKGIY